jgi:hypothetical protein
MALTRVPLVSMLPGEVMLKEACQVISAPGRARGLRRAIDRRSVLPGKVILRDVWEKN